MFLDMKSSHQSSSALQHDESAAVPLRRAPQRGSGCGWDSWTYNLEYASRLSIALYVV